MADDRSGAPVSCCSCCGRPFPDRAGWPRRCPFCAHVTYRNPLPVAVLAVPVEDLGVLMVRRVAPPAGLALPSGYILRPSYRRGLDRRLPVAVRRWAHRRARASGR